jgi:IS30 family transposase
VWVRVGFSVEQQDLIWAMWRRGDAIREMERTLGETLPRIRRYLRQWGGIPPIPRRRRANQLTLAEREEISRGIAAGWSARRIALRIDRPSSTVSREIARNGGRDAYRALVADAAAFERARRPKPSKLATNPDLRGVVADKLDDDWSPQQIAQWLRQEFRGDAAMRISHESIYRDLYMPSRKVFDTNMFHRLRSDRSIRRPRGKKRSHGRGQIRNMVSIRERPTEADTRQVVGHWEGDLVFGARPSAVATLVDRATRYAMVVALPDGNKADAVARALIDYMGRLPAHLRRSLTWDRGSEMRLRASDRGDGIQAATDSSAFCVRPPRRHRDACGRAAEHPGRVGALDGRRSHQVNDSAVEGSRGRENGTLDALAFQNPERRPVILPCRWRADIMS